MYIYFLVFAIVSATLINLSKVYKCLPRNPFGAKLDPDSIDEIGVNLLDNYLFDSD